MGGLVRVGLLRNKNREDGCRQHCQIVCGVMHSGTKQAKDKIFFETGEVSGSL